MEYLDEQSGSNVAFVVDVVGHVIGLCQNLSLPAVLGLEYQTSLWELYIVRYNGMATVVHVTQE
jgi:hypothetical protein